VRFVEALLEVCVRSGLFVEQGFNVVKREGLEDQSPSRGENIENLTMFPFESAARPSWNMSPKIDVSFKPLGPFLDTVILSCLRFAAYDEAEYPRIKLICLWQSTMVLGAAPRKSRSSVWIEINWSIRGHGFTGFAFCLTAL
jgi:hypothetical protein